MRICIPSIALLVTHMYAFKYVERSVLHVPVVTIAAVKISQTSRPMETTMSRSMAGSILYGMLHLSRGFLIQAFAWMGVLHEYHPCHSFVHGS